MNLSMLLINAKTVAEKIQPTFKVFGITIHFYAIFMVLALSLCAVAAYFLFKRKNIKPELIIDVMIWVVPCSIVGARTWYVLMEIQDFVTNGWLDWKEVFNIMGGGLAIHGGVMGGAIGLLISSKIAKINMPKLFDVGATLLPLGQAIGRWGNFFNQEVYGRPTTVTWFPFSVYIERTGSYHYALFFYEMLCSLALLAFLLFFFYRYDGKRDLYSTGFYLMGYGVIRAIMEPFRAQEFQMGAGIPKSVYTAIAMFIIGATVFGIVLYKDIKDKNYWWKEFFKKKEKIQTQTSTASEQNSEVAVEIENIQDKKED